MDEEMKKYSSFVGFSVFIAFLGIMLLFVMLCSCTLSFQNIDTHGTATDLVDDVQSNTPTVDTKLEIPAKLVP